MNDSEIIYRLATELWKCSLGNLPFLSERHANMTSVTPGDFVFELTSIRSDNYENKIGWFVSLKGDDFDRIWTIRRYNDGRLITWENADFARVPFDVPMTKRIQRIAKSKGRMK